MTGQKKTMDSPVKGPLVHTGKGKRVYSIPGYRDWLWLEFRDDLTAFNGKKRSRFSGKGGLNRDTSSLVFRYLQKEGVRHHWVRDQGRDAMICHKLKMLPLEVVVRNRLAGSTAKRFGFPEGSPLKAPLVEFYYKDDSLQDPFISTEQIVAFAHLPGAAQVEELKSQALIINHKLKVFFDKGGMELIDFKMEFGTTEKGDFVLGDELSCDSCRLWDQVSGDKMDKDRFRRDLGQVQETYREVYERLLKVSSV